MSRILHLDAFSGAAGNMFMGALLDLGLSRAKLLEGLAPLGLDFKLVVKKVQRNGFASRYVDVRVPVSAKKKRAEEKAQPTAAHGHSHHHHGHDTHRHGRHYVEIRDLIAKRSRRVKDRPRIFEALRAPRRRCMARPSTRSTSTRSARSTRSSTSWRRQSAWICWGSTG